VQETKQFLKDITASIYQIQTAHEDAAQIGSFAFLLFAMVALSTNIGNAFLPLAERKLGMDSSFRKPPQPFHSLSLPKSGIVWAWFASHVLFATSMLATVIIDSWIGGTILVATLGVSWAMTTWAPYSIIGSEVSLHAGGEALGGTIMSLHNVAISTPQVLAAVISSFVFEVATTVGGNGTAWLLRAGGISALVAAWLTLNLDVDDTNLDS
jgi:solute carrier family 45 protein 1/2/4